MICPIQLFMNSLVEHTTKRNIRNYKKLKSEVRNGFAFPILSDTYLLSIPFHLYSFKLCENI